MIKSCRQSVRRCVGILLLLYNVISRLYAFCVFSCVPIIYGVFSSVDPKSNGGFYSLRTRCRL